MTVYYLMYFLILVGTPFLMATGHNQHQKRKRAAIYITLVITLVLALRHPSMGVDLCYGTSEGYLGSFRAIAQRSWSQLISRGGWMNYEWGYIFLNKLLGYVSTDYQWLLMICAVISIVPIGILIYRYSKDYVFSAVVYLGLPCFMMPFSGLRQGIAIGICCLACRYICEKKLIKFAVTVLAATMFHYSSVVFLVAYPLYHVKLSRNMRLMMVPVLGAVYVFRTPLFTILSKVFKDNAVPDNNNALTLLLVFTLMFLFGTMFLRYSDQESAGFLNVFYFACICQCFGGVYAMAMRVGYYFMPAMAIALPNIIVGMDNEDSYWISKICILSIFVAYGLYALHGGSWAMTNPYNFFWSGGGTL